MERIVREKFTCPICFDKHPLMGCFNCSCRKIYCVSCVYKGSIRKCLLCHSGTVFKPLKGDDLSLLEEIVEDSQCLYGCDFFSSSTLQHQIHNKTCTKRLKELHCPNKCGKSVTVSVFENPTDVMYFVHNFLSKSSCSKLKVFCSLCNKEYSSDELKKHRTKCLCGIYICSSVNLDTLVDHLKGCTHTVKIKCELCSDFMKSTVMKDHLIYSHKVENEQLISGLIESAEIKDCKKDVLEVYSRLL